VSTTNKILMILFSFGVLLNRIIN